MIHLEMGDVVTAKVITSARGMSTLHIHLDDDASLLIHKDWTPVQFKLFCEYFKVGEFAPKEEESVTS